MEDLYENEVNYFNYVQEALASVPCSVEDIQNVTSLYIFELAKSGNTNYVEHLVTDDKLLKKIIKVYFEELAYYDSLADQNIRQKEEYEKRFLGNPHAMSDSYDDQDYEDLYTEMLEGEDSLRM